MYQGRVEWGGHSVPVEIGGQLVRPDDLVVADGDGAIVVPVEVVDDVLKYAIQEAENDRKARGMLFDRLGIARASRPRACSTTSHHTRTRSQQSDWTSVSSAPPSGPSGR